MNMNKCIRQKVDLQQISRCKNQVAPLEDSFEYASGVMELAGNKVRMKLLYLLQQEKRLCVCDLSTILDMTIPAISQHLKKLKTAGLVSTQREAQTIYYALADAHEALLKPFFLLWFNDEKTNQQLTTSTIFKQRLLLNSQLTMLPMKLLHVQTLLLNSQTPLNVFSTII